MHLDPPTNTLIYSIEKAVKSYRRLAQKKLRQAGLDITIDQAIILFLLNENQTLSQSEIAKIMFKDHASIVRTINILITKKYIVKNKNWKDKRSPNLTLTSKADDLIRKATPIILSNRRKAYGGLTKSEQEELIRLSEKIALNCNEI